MFPLFIGGETVVLLWQEERHPMRTRIENKLSHELRNLGVGILSALTLNLTEKPLTRRLTRWVEHYHFGIIPSLRLSPIPNKVLAVLLLDYTLYLWHMFTHRNSFLWRFHEVHHEDIDLTASTAIRFHFCEMALSSLWRGAQILILGVNHSSLKLWQNLLFAEILFHHANIRLPIGLERILSKFIVTPRLHAIHHSTRKNETDSNWSSGFVIWDWLHGTLKKSVPQESIEIGVPAFGEKNDLKLTRLINKPFKKQRESWSPLFRAKIKRSTYITS